MLRTFTIGTRAAACAVVIALVLAGLTGAARADTGYYLTAIGGVGALADTSVDAAGFNADAQFDAGFDAGAAAGYDFGRWRLEGELVYRTNDSSSLRGTLPTGWSGGDFSSLGIAVNGLYEFDLGGSPNVTSYAGVGLVWLQEIDIDFATPAGERSFSSDAVGVQLLAGVNYRLTERWTMRAELRYLTTGSLTLEGEGAAAG